MAHSAFRPAVVGAALCGALLPPFRGSAHAAAIEPAQRGYYAVRLSDDDRRALPGDPLDMIDRATAGKAVLFYFMHQAVDAPCRGGNETRRARARLALFQLEHDLVIDFGADADGQGPVRLAARSTPELGAEPGVERALEPAGRPDDGVRIARVELRDDGDPYLAIASTVRRGRTLALRAGDAGAVDIEIALADGRAVAATLALEPTTRRPSESAMATLVNATIAYRATCARAPASANSSSADPDPWADDDAEMSDESSAPAPVAEGSVTIDVADGRIERVRVNGRPGMAKPFALGGGGMGEGDHTTAFGVYARMFENRLRGQTLVGASRALAAILAEIRRLPGAGACTAADVRTDFAYLTEHQVQAWQARCVAAGRAADQAVEGLRERRGDAIGALQTSVRALLAYRNSLGYAVVSDGVRAVGDGESKALRVLDVANAADPGAPLDEARVRVAAALLLSNKVRAQRADLAVLGARAGEVAWDAIADQHIASLASAFPRVFPRVRLTRADVQQPHTGDALGALPRPATAPTGERPAAAALVQLELRDGRIARVAIGARPHHANFGGSEAKEGSHTTAWRLIQLGMIGSLEGKTLDEAAAELRAMHHRMLRYPAVVDLSGTDAALLRAMRPGEEGGLNTREAAMAIANPSFYHVTRHAYAAVERDLEQGQGGASVSGVQRLASNLLWWRNSMGLTVIDNNEGYSTRLHEDRIEADIERVADGGARGSRAMSQLAEDSFDSQVVRGLCRGAGGTLTPTAGSASVFGVEDAPGLLYGESIASALQAYLTQHVFSLVEATDAETVTTWLESPDFTRFVETVTEDCREVDGNAIAKAIRTRVSDDLDSAYESQRVSQDPLASPPRGRSPSRERGRKRRRSPATERPDGLDADRQGDDGRPPKRRRSDRANDAQRDDGDPSSDGNDLDDDGGAPDDAMDVGSDTQEDRDGDDD